MNREEATEFVLQVLRNPLALLSKPTRERVLELSTQWGITAAQLIEHATKKSHNT